MVSTLTRPDHAIRVAAALAATGALSSGPGAMLLVSLTEPQPAWNGVPLFIEHYHPIQTLPYLLGFVLLAGFVLFTAACHVLARPACRVRTTAALVFTAVYAALVFTNYTLQVGYVPRLLASNSELIGTLTMSNPASFSWFLEMFGYAAFGVSTWLVASAFGGTRRGMAIRYLLIANGVGSIVGAVCTALFDRWVFSTSGLVGFGIWNALVPVCFILIASTAGGGLLAESRAPAAAPERVRSRSDA